jgi:hypothetical protein
VYFKLIEEYCNYEPSGKTSCIVISVIIKCEVVFTRKTEEKRLFGRYGHPLG